MASMQRSAICVSEGRLPLRCCRYCHCVFRASQFRPRSNQAYAAAGLPNGAAARTAPQQGPVRSGIPAGGARDIEKVARLASRLQPGLPRTPSRKAIERNRNNQARRNQRRRILQLEKNNLAF